VEPEEVLELVRSAPERYDTVRAALHYRGDGATQREIRQRLLRSEAGQRAFRISPEEASEPIRHPEPEGPFGWRCRAASSNRTARTPASWCLRKHAGRSEALPAR
jgi:hypothetical protein